MNKIQMVLVLLSLPLALWACNEDPTIDDGPDVEAPVVPCGGDVVGTWQMVEAYIPGIETMLTAMAPACHGALTAEFTGVSGTMTFTAGGASSYNGSLSQSVSMMLTEPCLQDLFQDESVTASSAICDSSAILMSGADESPFDAAACNFIGATCDCDANVTTTIIQSGTYTLPGNNTIVDQDGVASPYCVDDDIMLIEAVGDAGATVNLKLFR